MKVNKSKYDISKIFLTYMTLVGDVDKTAAALDMDPAVVQSLATSEEWEDKVRRLSMMSKSGKPGDYERAANRALNFVQAHRLRNLLTSLLSVYEDKDPSQLAEMKAAGFNAPERPSCRFFADLAAAMEKAHQLSYQALGDTVGERESRTERGEGEVSGAALHAAVLSALNSTSVKNVTPEEIIARSEAEYIEEVRVIADVPRLEPVMPNVPEVEPNVDE